MCFLAPRQLLLLPGQLSSVLECRVCRAAQMWDSNQASSYLISPWYHPSWAAEVPGLAGSCQRSQYTLEEDRAAILECCIPSSPTSGLVLLTSPTATPAPSGVDPHGLQKELPESPESQIPTAAANKRLLHTTKEIGLGARCTVPISLLPGHCSVVRAAPADTVCTANLTNRSVSPMQTPSP